MANVKPIPEGCEGLIPHLVVDNAAEAIEFYTKAFGAQEIYRAAMPDGKKIMHAEVRIGSGVVYLSDDFPEWTGKSRAPKALGGSPLNIHRYVEDVDATIKRAEAAGAKVTMPPEDQFWGDRYGKLTDPYGHEWAFATHIKDVTPEEMQKAAEEMFAQAKSPPPSFDT
jgi:uncharacterized glyoxalase superfamily protein PhnB